MRKHKTLDVSPELIAERLHLPEGTDIIGAIMDLRHGSIEFVVTHPDFPELPEAADPPPVDVRFTRTDDGIVSEYVEPQPAREYVTVAELLDVFNNVEEVFGNDSPPERPD